MISKASAPGKIILCGEHFVVYGTDAVIAAIDKRITVASEKVSEPVIIIKSHLDSTEIKISEEGTSRELRPFEFLAKKMISEFEYTGGIKIQIRSEIPHGVGLGSSSASCVAAAASISGLFAKYDRQRICELAIDAEKTIFENTSGADCTACTFGGIIRYSKEGFERIESAPNLNLIIANSKMIHRTDKIVSKVSEFKKNNQQRFEQLCKKEAKLVQSIKKEIESENITKLGELMKQNHAYLREIGVSNETLENIIDRLDKVSLGAKITGAGGGGCIIAIADTYDTDEIKKIKEQIQCFDAKIDYIGLDTF